MSLGTSNRDGGKTSESGHLRALAKMVSGDVLEGLNVSQRGAGANMSVDVAVGDAFVRRSDGSYAHPVFNDAVYNQVITTADGSNPRRDIVVIYVDYGQSPSTAVSNNTNGVVKIKVVTGTPAGSPVDPNSTAIQSSVGAGNPYSILARVRVPAGQTSITNSLIDDLRSTIYQKDGTVKTNSISDGQVTTPKIGDSQVTGSKLSTSAITIGYASTTTTQTGLGSTEVNLTSLSITVTVPSGGRKVELSFVLPNFNSTGGAGDQCRIFFKEGTTYLSSSTDNPASSFGHLFNGAYIFTPTAGTHTYYLSYQRTNGTGTGATNAAADAVCYFTARLV